MTSDLKTLVSISQLKYMQSERALASIRVREHELRRELERLRDLERETHSQSDADAELRAIGGDIIWLKWVAQSRRSLNIELAQILAAKENLMSRHKRVTGEKSVTEALYAQQATELARNKAEKSLNQAVEATLIRSIFNSPGARSR